MAYPPCPWKSIASRMASPPGPGPPAWLDGSGDRVSFTPSAATASQPAPGGETSLSRLRAWAAAGAGGAEGSAAAAIPPRAASVPPLPASAQAASRATPAVIRRQAVQPEEPEEEDEEEEEAGETEPGTGVMLRRQPLPAPVASRRG